MRNGRMRVIFFLLLVAPAARADIIPPVGLATSDQFRLMFVSSQTHDFTSTNVAVYDVFINNLAFAAGLGSYNGNPVTWHALVSTPSVNAIDRLPNANIPIYNMNGDLVADATHNLWLPSATCTLPCQILLHAIEFTELDTVAPPLPGLFAPEVWTDTTISGTHTGIFTVFGIASFSDPNWIAALNDDASSSKYIYGYSDPIVVATPEPESITLSLTAVVLLGLFRSHLRRLSTSAHSSLRA